MKPSLTSCERMNRAIGRKAHDRVPRHETFWQDTLNRWEREGFVGGQERALELLGSDLRQLSPLLWAAPFPGRYEVLSEDANTRVIRDPWGATLREFKDRQTTPTHLGWECISPEIWRDIFKPAILNPRDDGDPQDWLPAFRTCRQQERWGYLVTAEPFEFLRKILGDEEMLVCLKDDPEWIRDIAITSTDRTMQILQKWYAAGLEADGLWIYGDMAFNHSTFCSPADYREIIWPEHKRLCDWAHARGMRVIYHTDGNINGVIELLLEAGVDILQPLECKAGMDIRELAPGVGNRLSFFGNIDVMKLIGGDEEAIEAEIRDKFAAGMARNGYVYHSDHSIPPQVSWDLYTRIIAWVEKYGVYRD